MYMYVVVRERLSRYCADLDIMSVVIHQLRYSFFIMCTEIACEYGRTGMTKLGADYYQDSM